MAKFDHKIGEGPTSSPSPIQTTTGADEPTTLTNEGGAGWTRDAKGELFLLAVSNMVSENTFYESGKDRDKRFVSLVHSVSKSDPEWMARFIPWLRNTANMRSASVAAAIEYGVAFDREKGYEAPLGPLVRPRAVVGSALARADEPGEALAYWGAFHGDVKHPPKWLKRGVADAVQRLYTERAALKWDSSERNIRLGDVIEIVHPDRRGSWANTETKSDPLWQYLLDVRHGHKIYSGEPGEINPIDWLPMIGARARLNNIPQTDRRAWLEGMAETLNRSRGESISMVLGRAGMTWEALSGWLNGPMDRIAWESIIPSMGYMALLRNLRNFDEAGVSDEVKAKVVAKLTDPEEVKASRQFPLRFYSAYREVRSDFWRYPLGRALDMTLQNVPALPGRTLILVDDSGSMYSGMSGRSKLQRHEAAKLFGLALALRAENPELIVYSDVGVRFDVPKGSSLLNLLTNLPQLGRGTYTFETLRRSYNGHDRVVILTDEQAHDSGTAVPSGVPIYTFNLGGYQPAHLASDSKRITIGGGLTDSAFTMIDSIEKLHQGSWPF